MSLRIVFLAAMVWTAVYADRSALAQAKAAAQPKPAAQPKAAEAPKNDAAKAKGAPAANVTNFGTVKLKKLASDKSLLFFASDGWQVPDPQSTNKTEQLCSEKSLQTFFQSLIGEIKEAFENLAPETDETANTLATSIPVLFEAGIQHPIALSLKSMVLNPFSPSLSLAVVIDTESDKEKVQEAFENLIGLSPEQGPQALFEEQIRGVTFYHPLINDREKNIIPRFGMFESYLIFTIGPDTAEDTVLKLSEGKSFPEWLQATFNDLKVDRPTTVFHLNMAGIWDTLDPLITMPPVRTGLKASGLMDIQRIAMVSGYDSQLSVSKTVVETSGAPKGLLTLLPDKPLTADDLQGIPANPTQAHLIRFDLENLVEIGLQIAERIDSSIRGQYDGLSQQGEGLLGFSFKNDVLKAFGDAWGVSIAGGDTAGGVVPEIIATVTVRDQQKLTKVLDSLVSRARPFLQSGAPGRPNASIDAIEVKGNKGYQMSWNGVNAGWVVTKDRLIVGQGADQLTAYLSGLDSKTSLATNPEVLAALKRDPKTVQLSYHDPKHELQSVYQFIQQMTPVVVAQLNSQGIQFEMPELPPLEPLQRHFSPSVSTLSRSAKGWYLEGRGVVPQLGIASPALVAVGAGLLLPGIRQARWAAQRTQSKNNLKEIGLAMHNYHDVHNAFPARAIRDAKGKPLLSWRIQLLPYLDQAALYNEFHLDEPWDSEHNQKLIERMPAVFASPDHPELAKEFKTRYVVAVSPGALFEGEEGPGIREITDGTSLTIMVLEANEDHAVRWTKPDDLEIDLDDPLDGLEGNPSNTFNVLFGDGSVRQISVFIDVEMFKRLLTKSGGEVVNFGDF